MVIILVIYNYVNEKIFSGICRIFFYGFTFIIFCVDCMYCQTIRRYVEILLMPVNVKCPFQRFSNRYNVPFYTVNSGLVPILALSWFIGSWDNASIVIAYFIYVFVYCKGMHNVYIEDRKKYLYTLKHNIEFLDMSMWPSVMFMTIAGVYLTASGKTVDIRDIMTYIYQMIFTNFDTLYALFYALLKILIVLVIFVYSFSLPLQILLYIAIRAIMYYQKHLMEYR